MLPTAFLAFLFFSFAHTTHHKLKSVGICDDFMDTTVRDKSRLCDSITETWYFILGNCYTQKKISARGALFRILQFYVNTFQNFNSNLIWSNKIFSDFLKFRNFESFKVSRLCDTITLQTSLWYYHRDVILWIIQWYIVSHRCDTITSPWYYHTDVIDP